MIKTDNINLLSLVTTVVCPYLFAKAILHSMCPVALIDRFAFVYVLSLTIEISVFKFSFVQVTIYVDLYSKYSEKSKIYVKF